MLGLGFSLSLALRIETGLAAESGTLGKRMATLPVLPEPAPGPGGGDWLVSAPPQRAGIFRSHDGKELVLNNGLLSRTWRLAPNAATVAFDNLMTDQPVIRAVRPEAILTINNVRVAVGGLSGQPNHGYLRKEWLDTMRSSSNALTFVDFEVGPTQPRLSWKRKRYAVDAPWPPPGMGLTLHFQGNPDLASSNGPPTRTPLAVDVHYEIYDGIPLLAKWFTLSNAADESLSLIHI